MSIPYQNNPVKSLPWIPDSWYSFVPVGQRSLRLYCIHHIHKDQFIRELKPSSARISVAKSKVSVTAKGVGDVRIFWLGTDLVVNSTIVRDVLYVSDASDCLLSIGKLEDRGTELETKSAKNLFS